MKLLLENWRGYLEEQPRSMDSFVSGTERQESVNSYWERWAQVVRDTGEAISVPGSYNVFSGKVGQEGVVYFLVNQEGIPKLYLFLEKPRYTVDPVVKAEDAKDIHTSKFYKYLIDKHGFVSSGTDQTPYSQELWSRLESDPEIEVEIHDDQKRAFKSRALKEEVDTTVTRPPKEKVERVIPPKIESILEDRGFYVNRFIDEGKYGKIWELESSASGRRLAVKVVSALLAGQQIDREEANYRWILKNRSSLPAKVKEHLVNVYSVDRFAGKDLIDHRGQPYQMDSGALVVVMELLEPAPERVIHDLLATGDDEEISAHKVSRIFKDEGAVNELVTNMVKQIEGQMTAAIERWSSWHVNTLVKEVVNAFLTNDKASARENLYVDYGKLQYYVWGESFKPHGQRLLNILFNKVDSMLPDYVKQYELDKDLDPTLKDYYANRRQHILESVSYDLDQALYYYVKKQVVPMTYGAPTPSRTGGAEKHTQDAFPEAAGLIDAMSYLHGKSFTPKDMHAKNIMTRPDTGQLVMVDVGLFKSL